MEGIRTNNGQITTYRPATFVSWRAEDLETAPEATANKTIAIIGEAEGGIPLAPYVLGDARRARAALRGGELLDATLLALNAAGAGSGVTVIAVNVKGGTPATVDLPSTDPEVAFGTLTTRAYRERANQTDVQLSGTPQTGYTVALRDGDTGFELVNNRLGLGIFLQYRGQGLSATATVDEIDGQLTLITEIEGRPEENLRIPLSESETVAALCARIQRSGPYTAASGRDDNLLASDLDPVESVDIARGPVSTPRAPAALTAVRADFVRFFATYGGQEVTFEPNADAPQTAVPAAAFRGVFSGGRSLPVQPDAWAVAMDNLAKVALVSVVPLTDDPVVLAGLRADMEFRNNATNSNFGQLVCGFQTTALPSNNDAAQVDAFVRAVVSELSSVNDHQVYLIANTVSAQLPGSKRTVVLPTYMTAAIFAGAAVGQGYNRSMTYADLPGALGVFPELNLDQSGEIVRAGGVCFEVPRMGATPRVVRDRTTFARTNNPIYESGMSVRIMNSAARGIKALQDRFIPGEASLKRLADLQSAAEDYFEALVAKGDLSTGGLDPATGQGVSPWSFRVERTRSGGRHVVSHSVVVPKGEFVVGEHEMVGRPVEFEIRS